MSQRSSRARSSVCASVAGKKSEKERQGNAVNPESHQEYSTIYESVTRRRCESSWTVGGSLGDAVSRLLDSLCRDFRYKKAEQDLDNITVVRTGILARLESSDEPPQAPHKPAPARDRSRLETDVENAG